MFLPKTTILVPGRGHIDMDAIKVHKAVHEYDERLHFGFNETNGDWVVYYILDRGSDAAYFIDGKPAAPVYGFGKTIPSPDEAVIAIKSIDSRLWGDKLLDDIEKHNEAIKKDREDKASDASGEVAEGIEWAHRKLGTHPRPRIFIPDKA